MKKSWVCAIAIMRLIDILGMAVAFTLTVACSGLQVRPTCKVEGVGLIDLVNMRDAPVTVTKWQGSQADKIEVTVPVGGITTLHVPANIPVHLMWDTGHLLTKVKTCQVIEVRM